LRKKGKKMVTATATAQKPAGVSAEEFEKIKIEIVSLIKENNLNWEKISKKLVDLSTPQIRQIKALLHKIGVSSTKVDRLLLYAKGSMPKHLAFSDNGPPPPLWESLPKKEQEKISNPNLVVEFLTRSDGVIFKPVSQLDAIGWRQVLRKNVGILPAKDQAAGFGKQVCRQKRNLKKMESATQRASRARYVYDGMLLDKENPNNYLVFGRDKEDPPGSRKICIEMPVREFKRFSL